MRDVLPRVGDEIYHELSNEMRAVVVVFPLNGIWQAELKVPFTGGCFLKARGDTKWQAILNLQDKDSRVPRGGYYEWSRGTWVRGGRGPHALEEYDASAIAREHEAKLKAAFDAFEKADHKSHVLIYQKHLAKIVRSAQEEVLRKERVEAIKRREQRRLREWQKEWHGGNSARSDSGSIARLDRGEENDFHVCLPQEIWQSVISYNEAMPA